MTFLAFVQPLVRGWSRYFTWLQFKRTPRAVIARTSNCPGTERAAVCGAAVIGTKRARTASSCSVIFALLEREGWRYSTDTGWNEWDIQIYGNFWWSVTLANRDRISRRSEMPHARGLRYRFVTTTVIINLVALSLVIYRQLNVGHAEPWLIAVYSCFVFFLGVHARRLKHRVAELVDLAAYQAGLQRIGRRGVAAETTAIKTAPKVEVG